MSSTVEQAAAAVPAVGIVPPAPEARGRVLPTFSFAVGVLLVLGPLVASFVARIFVSRHGTLLFAYQGVLKPSSTHVLGTDAQGRDVLASIVYGIVPTFEIGLLAGLVGVCVGTVLGVVSGYFGGLVDSAIRGVADVMLGIPPFALLVVIAALWGSLSVIWLGVAIALLSWPLPARAIRAQILSLREQGFVVMSRLSNRNAASIMFLEILPNMLPYVTATFVGLVSGGLLTAIGLELLGLGPVGIITLGSMLQSALTFGAISQGIWWWWAAPTVLLVLLFLGLFLLSLSVDRISNPRLAGTRG
ncbi:MAG: ABC transporter permease [Thermoleophilia bacterium]|nr:ABC transporter permease [Thermoleophilia bacterium]